MKRTKKEIEDELNHKSQIIRALRARIRPLELQSAQKGLNSPPEITTEIATLTDLIRIQEDEIAKLESLAAEGQLSMAEAELRVTLAEVWDTPIGRPTAAGAARLELVRLRLGLSDERAQTLAQEIRGAIVEDIFLKIDLWPILGKPRRLPAETGPINVQISPADGGSVAFERFEIHQTITISDSLESTLWLIGKTIRLDPVKTLRLFIRCLPEEPKLDLPAFQKLLLSENRVWIISDEYQVFNDFLANLAIELNMGK
jgi:hypothetical protein